MSSVSADCVLSFRVEMNTENFYVSIQDRTSFGLYICRDRTSNLTEFQILSTELPIASPVDRSSNWKLIQDILSRILNSVIVLPIGSSADRNSNYNLQPCL